MKLSRRLDQTLIENGNSILNKDLLEHLKCGHYKLYPGFLHTFLVTIQRESWRQENLEGERNWNLLSHHCNQKSTVIKIRCNINPLEQRVTLTCVGRDANKISSRNIFRLNVNQI